MSKNDKIIENFSRLQCSVSELWLQYLPNKSDIKIIIPEHCINRFEGKIRYDKFIQYLQSLETADLKIEYERR